MSGEINESVQLLEAVFKNVKGRDGNVNIRYRPKGTDRVNSVFVGIGKLTVIKDLIIRNYSCNFWFGVGVRNENNGKKDGVSELPGSWLDQDKLTPEEEAQIISTNPNIIIQTSVESHKQFYWLFEKPATGDEIGKVESINKALIKQFGGDPGTWERARLLRIPGTRNYKPEYGPLFPICKIISMNLSKLHTLEDFGWLDAMQENVSQGTQIQQPKTIEITPTIEDWEKAKKEISKYNRIMFHFLTPKPEDRSGHDWRLACLCLEYGITDPKLLYQIILNNPHGKAQHYPQTNKYIVDLISKCLAEFKITESKKESFPESIISGIAGEFVNLYSQAVESPRPFIYMAFMTCLGSMLSTKLALKSERRFEPRYYVLLLGESAIERKSTALDIAIDFFREFFGSLFSVCHGVGSAEGLQLKMTESINGNLMLAIDEIKGLLSKCRIEGSVLLPCLNTLFEKTYYESRTKSSDIKVENGHLSLLSASTIPTYESVWSSVFIDIGLPNRLFIVPSTSERKFPVPGQISQHRKSILKDKIQTEIVDRIDKNLEMELTPEANKLFSEWYFELAKEESIHTKRLDTYALRFMPLLAINDGKLSVDEVTVQKSIDLMNWQKLVREEYDPISSSSIVGITEEKIRRRLRKGPHTTYELKHQIRGINKDSLWVFNQALNNLSTGVGREIQFNPINKRWELI